jgi:hypothetical protein
MTHVFGMSVEYIQNFDVGEGGGTSGSLFGSQRRIKANGKIDIDEVEYCFCLLLTIVNNNNI